jgi:hypothetical protein
MEVESPLMAAVGTQKGAVRAPLQMKHLFNANFEPEGDN